MLEMDFKGLAQKNAAKEGSSEPNSGDNSKEKSSRTMTAGERQYMAHGISGIRGEAAGGFRSVAEYGLPYFKQCLADGIDFEEAGSLTLLNLITHVTDTNIIARSDVETQKSLQQEILDMLSDGKRPDRSAIEALDEKFIRLNVSPGGCADLLAITYFLWLWEQAA